MTQQNVITEPYVKQRGLLMLFDAELPNKYWGETVATANYLQNLLPTKAIKCNPYKLWNSEKPRLDHIRAFGSVAYAYVPKETRTKWDARAQTGILVGYNETSHVI
ncbi:hypothetical protein JTB14_024256 [Gonioctena quinquepunctata]|nr:hypothetical protein JTB14_024256 [Gonioctena quinquepunctata]